MTPHDAMPLLGRLLIVAGLVIAAIGAMLAWGVRLPFLGRLPGDLVFGRNNFRVYVPITSSLLVSLLLTLVLALVAFLRR